MPLVTLGNAMRLLTLILVSCLLAFEGTTSLYAAIVIDGYTHATNDRFTDSPTFVLNGSDLSGVGQDASGRWATAISRNVIISANHFQPSGTVFSFPIIILTQYLYSARLFLERKLEQQIFGLAS